MMVKHPQGFTLAELLIALAILGVIAVFTIPKVLNSQQDSQKRAVLKEAVASLYQICEIGANEGSLDATTSGTQLGTYFLDHLNFIKTCPGDSLAQGCWNASQGNISFDDNQMGGIMHNGAVIVGFGDNSNTGRESVTIDLNGIKGPNTISDDQIRLDICLLKGATSGCFIDSAYEKNPYPTYQVGPFTGGSETLWGEAFTR